MTAEHVHELPPKGGHIVVRADEVEAVEGGAVIEFARGGHVFAVLLPVDPDQAWFWTPEWQAKEREFDADRAAGVAPRRFDSGDEFLDFLDEEIAAADAAASQCRLF